ncbi:MAG: aldehyde dehydrogenase family protein [Methylovirgula sp.]
MKWAVWGRMYNTGQTCCAAKRFVVVEKLADEFLEKFKAGAHGSEARATRWMQRPHSVPCPRNRPWLTF